MPSLGLQLVEKKKTKFKKIILLFHSLIVQVKKKKTEMELFLIFFFIIKGCGSASLGYSGQVSYSLNGTDVIAKLQGDSGRTTQINFKCLPNSGVGFPKFLEENPIKNYIFEWSTQYACPLPPSNCEQKKKKTDFLISYFSGSFSVSNDRVIDLSSLRSDDDLFVAPNYSINICAPLVTPCVSTIQDSIGCQRDTTAQYSIGKYNQFEYSYDLSSSSLNITYMGGDYGRVTNYIISCATDFVPPYFLNENPVKVYNFVWKTPLVCNQNITKKFK